MVMDRIFKIHVLKFSIKYKRNYDFFKMVLRPHLSIFNFKIQYFKFI